MFIKNKTRTLILLGGGVNTHERGSSQEEVSLERITAQLQ